MEGLGAVGRQGLRKGLKMVFRSFLLKYGEIGIKGKNRGQFEDALVRQVQYALAKVEGWYPNSSTTWKICCWVSFGIRRERGWRLRQMETVAADTPAFFATSFNDARI